MSKRKARPRATRPAKREVKLTLLDKVLRLALLGRQEPEFDREVEALMAARQIEVPEKTVELQPDELVQNEA